MLNGLCELPRTLGSAILILNDAVSTCNQATYWLYYKAYKITGVNKDEIRFKMNIFNVNLDA